MEDNSTLAMAIIKAIQDFFRNAENNNEAPTDDVEAWGESQYSPIEISDIIEFLAVEAGAETAIVRYQSKVMRGKIRPVDIQYCITFTVARGSVRYYRTYINYWFDPKRRTIFR
jgi:hypothetical protein